MMAHAGVILATRAAMPRVKPFAPSVRQIVSAILSAPIGSPAVCRRVFSTSTGCYPHQRTNERTEIICAYQISDRDFTVITAAIEPDRAPAAKCTDDGMTSRSLVRLRSAAGARTPFSNSST
jgi:hypothetical protein